LHIRTISLVIAAALMAGISIPATKSWARSQTSPKELVDEVWQILDQDYVDGTFNHHDWHAVRQEYLSRSYSSEQQAYKAIQEIVAKLGDPYTAFLDPQKYKQFNAGVMGKLSGVGIELTENQKTKALTVVNTLSGTPAAAAGILPQDVIAEINGTPTQGINIVTSVKRILGPAGTQVVLTVRRGSQELTFKLTRANIELSPISYHTQVTPIGNVGYIRLPEFTENSPARMRQAIAALETQQVKGYILDLRSDPGGLLNASLAIAKMWLKQGTIVSLVNRKGVQDRFTTHGPALTNKPLVVLVDVGSASASEILAAALQDNGRATLVGTRTFGKGLVQSLQELKDGSALKVTIAKYYTPKGHDINHVGITPNLVVSLTDAQQKALLLHQIMVGTPADPQYAKAVTELNQLIQTEAKMPLAVKPVITQAPTSSALTASTSSHPSTAPLAQIPKPSQHWVKVTVGSDNARVDIDTGTVTQAGGNNVRFWQRNTYPVPQANGTITALLYQSMNCQQQTYQFFKEITLGGNDRVLRETRDGQLSTVFPVASGTPSGDLFKRFCQ